MDSVTLAAHCGDELLRRNDVCARYVTEQAPRLAAACHEMSRRFLAGGRLLACGHGAAATDAQHVVVEFVHPVIVGKRALPALDVGAIEGALPVLVRPDDMVMAFAFPIPVTAPPRGAATEPRGHGRGHAGQWDERGLGGPESSGASAQNPEGASGASRVPAVGMASAVQAVARRGALTFALAGDRAAADYPFPLPDDDPFVCQEVFEILYHMLWETVHVYFEHREQGHDVGASSFLYPFLGRQEQRLDDVVAEVQGSMLQKMAEVNAMRGAMAATEVAEIARTAAAVVERLRRGGKIVVFGNGGSATDANDLAIDCVAPPPDLRPLPALSLATEPATITAIANDIGSEAVFTRQLIAHAWPEDVAVGISTSGGSANILAALAEARKRGLLTVALVGYDGGRIVGEHLADHAVVVRSDYIPRIQEVQASAYHVLRRCIDALFREA